MGSWMEVSKILDDYIESISRLKRIYYKLKIYDPTATYYITRCDSNITHIIKCRKIDSSPIKLIKIFL